MQIPKKGFWAILAKKPPKIFTILEKETIMKMKKILLLLLCVSLFWTGCVTQTSTEKTSQESDIQTTVSENDSLPYYEVLKVIDGDTIKIDYNGTPQTGRLLCYVYVDGKCINEELLRAGMAMVLVKKPNTSKTEEYKKIQAEARKNKIGIWQDIKANYPKKNISDK